MRQYLPKIAHVDQRAADRTIAEMVRVRKKAPRKCGAFLYLRSPERGPVRANVIVFEAPWKHECSRKRYAQQGC